MSKPEENHKKKGKKFLLHRDGTAPPRGRPGTGRIRSWPGCNQRFQRARLVQGFCRPIQSPVSRRRQPAPTSPSFKKPERTDIRCYGIGLRALLFKPRSSRREPAPSFRPSRSWSGLTSAATGWLAGAGYAGAMVSSTAETEAAGKVQAERTSKARSWENARSGAYSKTSNFGSRANQ